MKNLFKLFLSLILVLNIYSMSFSQFTTQIFFDGYESYGVQDMFHKSSMIKGNDGHIYTCGATLNALGDYDMLLTKLTLQNQEVWSVTYGGLANGDDFAVELAQDSNGDIIITGAEFISSIDYDAVTIKYNSSGVQQWKRSYDGNDNLLDGGASVVIDSYDDIYVCGGTTSNSTLSDFVVIKYSSLGSQDWVTTWNHSNLQDVATRLEVRGSSVSVIGGAQQNATDWKMANVKLNATTGVISGTKVSGGDSTGIDRVSDLAIDSLDNTYIIGSVKNLGQGYDLKILKLDPELEILWEKDYSGSTNGDDEGLSLELTSNDDVVICGYTNVSGEGKNILVQKYSNFTGTVLWTRIYDNQQGDDEAVSIKLDENDNAIICGSVFKHGNLDVSVQFLDGNTGAIKRQNSWNSDFNSDDKPMDLVVYGDTIYIAGQSINDQDQFQYIVTRWVNRDLASPRSTYRMNSQGFVTNRGQLQNSDSTYNSNIKYFTQGTWPSIYLTDFDISYVWEKKDSLAPDTVHRIDMKFNKGSSSAKIYPSEKLPHYSNIYLGQLSSKLERTEHYHFAHKLDAYSNTDVVFSSHSQGYKHYIIAKDGAPTADFEMEYSGHDSIFVDSSGDLVLRTILCDHVQSKARVYNLDSATGELYQLSWQPDYVISGDKVSFNYTGTWTGTLVIEIGKKLVAGGGGTIQPENLDWSTYYGGTGEEKVNDLASDDQRLYAVGSTINLEYPTQIGANTYSCASCDYRNATIQAFDIDNSQLLYSVMIGGNSDDYGHEIVSDDENHIYMGGASLPFPNTNDMYTQAFENAYFVQNSLSGYSTFLTRFLGDTGQLQWSTFLTGGNTGEELNLTLNEENELFVAGGQGGLVGLTLTGSGYQYTDPDNSNVNAFIMSFNGDLQISWATEFASACHIKDIDITPNDELVICGFMPTDNPSNFAQLASNGEWTSSSQSAFLDGFFAVFDSSNNLVWSSWFGGAALSESIYSVSSIGNSIFFCGNTSSATDFPLVASGNHYFDNTSSGFDGFISQFDNGQLVWSTLYGGNGYERLLSIEAKSSTELFISGETSSTNGSSFLQSNIGAFNQSNLNAGESNSNYDALMIFFENKELLWGTYLGGNGGGLLEEIGSSLEISNDNTKLFVGGSARSDFAFPWWDFDGVDSDISYFDDFLEDNDATDGWIARFNIDDIVLSTEGNTDVNSSQVVVYPNPTSGILNITFNDLFKEDYEINIYDLQGKSVKSTSYSQNGSNILNIDIRGLSDGLYTISIKSSTFRKSMKFIKQNG